MKEQRVEREGKTPGMREKRGAIRVVDEAHVAEGTLKSGGGRGHGRWAEDCAESVPCTTDSVISVIVIMIIVNGSITYYNCYRINTRANIGISVGILKVRGRKTSQRTCRGAVVKCLTLCRKVGTTTRLQKSRSTVNNTRKSDRRQSSRTRWIAITHVCNQHNLRITRQCGENMTVALTNVSATFIKTIDSNNGLRRHTSIVNTCTSTTATMTVENSVN